MFLALHSFVIVVVSLQKKSYIDDDDGRKKVQIKTSNIKIAPATREFCVSYIYPSHRSSAHKYYIMLVVIKTLAIT